jgi:hypothetical protein
MLFVVVVLFYVSWTTTVVSYRGGERKEGRESERERERERERGGCEDTLHSGRHVQNKVRITVPVLFVICSSCCIQYFHCNQTHITLWHYSTIALSSHTYHYVNGCLTQSYHFLQKICFPIRIPKRFSITAKLCLEGTWSISPLPPVSLQIKCTFQISHPLKSSMNRSIEWYFRKHRPASLDAPAVWQYISRWLSAGMYNNIIVYMCRVTFLNHYLLGSSSWRLYGSVWFLYVATYVAVARIFSCCPNLGFIVTWLRGVTRNRPSLYLYTCHVRAGCVYIHVYSCVFSVAMELIIDYKVLKDYLKPKNTKGYCVFRE